MNRPAYSIQRWDFKAKAWVHTWTCYADNATHAVNQGRTLGITGRIRAILASTSV